MSSLTPYQYQEELYHIPKQIVVIMDRPWHKILDQEKALLTKILGSVRVHPDAVVIQDRRNVLLKELAAINAGKVLVFGVPVEPDIKPYENTVLNELSVIRADDFSQLDDTRKKSLWMALKHMFGV